MVNICVRRFQVIPRLHAYADPEDFGVGAAAVVHPGPVQQALRHRARHDPPLHAQPPAHQGRRAHVPTQADMRAASVINPPFSCA